MGTKAIRRWAGAVAALGLLLTAASCGRDAARAPVPIEGAPPTIARADLFGDPARSEGRLSPRGDRVAFLSPRDGVSNIWVLSVDAMDEARPVTDDRQRGVHNFTWAQDNATLLYLQDDRGDENWRLYAVAADGGAPRALTPAGARAEIIGMSASDPTGVVISLNQRDAAAPDAVRVDVVTGEQTILQRNTGGFTRYVLDREGRVRLALRNTNDGAAELVTFAANGRATPLFAIPFEDAPTTTPIAFEADGRSFLMFDSPGVDRVALVRVDAASGEKTVLGESARADVTDVWLDPASNTPEAFATEYLRREWRALDTEAQADIDFLDRQLTGDFTVVSRSADDARWIVVEEGPATPARSYLYDRADRQGRRLTQLFRHRPALEQAALQPMTPVEIQARDGLTLVSYLTLPIGSDANGDARPEEPVPLVLAVHDGPWRRDSYGFNALHQWLANRGYAVLSVNYRGSAGFGKAFLNAGNGQWGARMQEDLADAVQWAVTNGVAQRDRVAIVGSGYGGYASLAALAFTPEQFRCGASYAARTNLFSLLDAAPTSARPGLYLRIADARNEPGRQTLRDRSPLFHAARIRSPLLLSYGGRDPSVSRFEADQIAEALRTRRVGLTYLAFPDEGRELVRQQDRLSYLAVFEHFLGDCLGGRVEPVGASFEGASIHVFDGAVNVPGLSAFSRRPNVQPTSQQAPTETEGETGDAEEARVAPDEALPLSAAPTP